MLQLRIHIEDQPDGYGPAPHAFDGTGRHRDYGGASVPLLRRVCRYSAPAEAISARGHGHYLLVIALLRNAAGIP